jgi:hypothetical protein
MIPSANCAGFVLNVPAVEKQLGSEGEKLEMPSANVRDLTMLLQQGTLYQGFSYRVTELQPHGTSALRHAAGGTATGGGGNPGRAKNCPHHVGRRVQSNDCLQRSLQSKFSYARWCVC